MFFSVFFDTKSCRCKFVSSLRRSTSVALPTSVQRGLIYPMRAVPHGTSTWPKSAPQTSPECQYGCAGAVPFLEIKHFLNQQNRAIHLVHVLGLTRLVSTVGFIVLHIGSFLPAPPFLGPLGFWSPPSGQTMHLHTSDLSTDS